MGSNVTRSGGEGLERSCARTITSWIASRAPADGVELFRAWFAGEAYQKHRHDTYAIGLTDRGVQVFDYRGSVRTSMPGEVVVLYPDEPHDGRAGTGEGFGYRIVYVEPSRLTEALRVLRGRPYPLPFLRDPVSKNARLARAIGEAFRAPPDSLAIDSLVVGLAEGLMAGERRGAGRPALSRHVDIRGLERARQFLDAERTRVVRSTELEPLPISGDAPPRVCPPADSPGTAARGDRVRRGVRGPGALHPCVQGRIRTDARPVPRAARRSDGLEFAPPGLN